jgi:hypothetical protein
MNTYDVILKGTSIVMAEGNFWTDVENPPNYFMIDPSCEIDYDPWLVERPECEGMMIGEGRSADNWMDGVTTADSPELDPGTVLMRRALALRTRGEYTEALVILKTVVTNGEVPTAIRKWAVRQLLAVAQHMPGQNLSAYLRTTVTNHPSLARQVKSILPYSYLHEGEIVAALAAFDANIQQYPNSNLECAALYGKFVHALYTARDTSEARHLLVLLSNGYPESAEAGIARVQLENFLSLGGEMSPKQSAGNRGKGSAATLESGLPTKFNLTQNYPNPFNPATTINYDLPVDAIVTLKVYDLLGKEVLTLVDGFVPAGYHHVQLDGSRLSSGVYFYRMNAGTFTDVKKLLILK